MTREPQGTQAIKFRCNSWESDVDWFDPGDPLDHVDYMPDCTTDDILEIRILFPQCWDGQNLGSDNTSLLPLFGLNIKSAQSTNT